MKAVKKRKNKGETDKMQLGKEKKQAATHTHTVRGLLVGAGIDQQTHTVHATIHSCKN